MKLLVKRLVEQAVLPTKAYEHDAGYDLYSVNRVDLTSRWQIVTVHTGISVVIPEGYVGLIWDKSSMGSKGFKVLGGVIDSGYRGEILIKLALVAGNEENEIKAGSKVAQLLIQKVEHLDVEEVNELPDSERGEKGFGSSGI